MKSMIDSILTAWSTLGFDMPTKFEGSTDDMHPISGIISIPIEMRTIIAEIMVSNFASRTLFKVTRSNDYVSE